MGTRSRAIELGCHYLQTRGYNGFSFQTVADALGIKKASLHYYFASKEDLGLALLDTYQKSYTEWTEKQSHLPAPKKLEQMFQMFSQIICEKNKICPAGVLSADFESLSKRMKKRLQEFHQTQKNWIAATLKEGIEKKQFKKNLNPDTTADLILASVQGGIQVARLREDPRYFKALGKNLMGMISV